MRSPFIQQQTIFTINQTKTVQVLTPDLGSVVKPSSNPFLVHIIS